jgi:hypothetical protein
MTPEQKEYLQKIAIVALGGGLLGALIGQFASDPPTMGKTLLGTVLGGALTGVGYGFYLRTGGEGGQAVMAGFGQRLPHSLFRTQPFFRTQPIPTSGRVIRTRPAGRFQNLGALGAKTIRVSPGSCVEI